MCYLVYFAHDVCRKLTAFVRACSAARGAHCANAQFLLAAANSLA